MIKKKFKISGMHCTSSAMNIEWELGDLGVNAKCSYAGSELEVEYEPEEVDEEKIREAVEKIGYALV